MSLRSLSYGYVNKTTSACLTGVVPLKPSNSRRTPLEDVSMVMFWMMLLWLDEVELSPRSAPSSAACWRVMARAPLTTRCEKRAEIARREATSESQHQEREWEGGEGNALRAELFLWFEYSSGEVSLKVSYWPVVSLRTTNEANMSAVAFRTG